MGFVNYAIVRFSIYLVLGILLAQYFPISVFALYPLLVFLGITIILWFIARKQLIQTIYYGISVYICFFLIGYLVFQMRNPEFQKNHYSHSITLEHSYLIQIKISENLKPDIFNDKYFANVQAINGRLSKGKILLNVIKDSLTSTFLPDDQLLVYTSFSSIPAPLNPHQFDYSQYMRNLEVYDQIRISKKEIITTWNGKSTLFGKAQNVRSKMINRLKDVGISDKERAIIQALILGEKKDIDKQLYEEYAAAGAVHILAVSGLHVGILFLILKFLLIPFTWLKHGELIRSVLIVMLLWGFAFLAGLSPSVIRAVSMFSFFAVAMIFGRRTNALNTLFLSFLFLLFINPLWLFQVGFQLSYLAVFFILWFQPIFKKFQYSRYWMVRKSAGIITVTVSAQLGVLPLSLYYFHQFPGLFLLTNLIVLPTMTVYMIGGITIVILAFIGFIPEWLAQGYGFMVETLNTFIGWIARQDQFLFSDIHFSVLKAIGFYLLIIAMGLLFRKLTYHRLTFLLASGCLLTTIYIYDKMDTSKTQLIVFHKNRSTLIGHQTGKHLTLYTPDTITDHRKSYPIKSYKTARDVREISQSKLPTVFQYNSKTVIVLDSVAHLPNRQQVHTILLRNSPRINLNRWIDSLQPQQIIVDGSNYPSYVERWYKSSLDKNISFHYTAREGAFQMK